jgi:hypothetical protein
MLPFEQIRIGQQCDFTLRLCELELVTLTLPFFM